MENNTIVHDEFFQKAPFPVNRDGLEFVGQVYDENNNQVLEYLEPLKKALGI